ncbi:phosphatase PAP2 family protein [Psychroserpens ponticola]|uniref:Phosphatase PAP2 family protein n=1 Tax=Psychroserpens ponticola TaxID=2932268 RepID=A0ABY7S209_9FLAO|nr:phosphatase PAP2 family protein [Psychroserpens ponticola]WCO02491.1 phosphatase PAP2 family protein [Psychroserpens ponticola]
MLEELVQFDTELFVYLNGLGTEAWDGFWMFYTTKFNWIPFYAVLLYLLYKRLTMKMFLVTILVIILMITFTDQITNLFKKVLVMRMRPCYNSEINDIIRLVKDSCGGKFGYFSGHASNSMSVAVFISLMLRSKYKYLPYLLFVWAVAMGYSRIYVGVHYPLDVLSGMLFGSFSGFLFYRLFKFLQKKYDEN